MRRFDEDYVRELRAEAAKYRKRSKDYTSSQQMIVRLSAENVQLRDQNRLLENRNAFLEARRDEHDSKLARREQTIDALRAQLNERGQS